MANSKIKFQEEIIRINLYNGQTLQVVAEEFSWTDKQDSEEYTSTEKTSPYAVSFGKHEYDIDLKGIDPLQKQYFEDWMKAQSHVNGKTFKKGNLPYLRTYCYNEAGQPVLDQSFNDIYLEEISGTNNEPFDVKIKALTKL